MVCMYVCEVWMRLKVNTSVYALYGEANARSWKSSDRQTSKGSENSNVQRIFLYHTQHEQSIVTRYESESTVADSSSIAQRMNGGNLRKFSVDLQI